MDTNRHKKTNDYCPFCFMQLIEVISTGHRFCSNNVTCEYEVVPGGEPPMDRHRMLLARIDRLNDCLVTIKQHQESLTKKRDALVSELQQLE